MNVQYILLHTPINEVNSHIKKGKLHRSYEIMNFSDEWILLINFY